MPRNLENEIWENGVVRVPGVFSRPEVDELRSVAERHFSANPYRHNNLGCHQPDAAATVPELGWVFRDPRVISLFQQATGSDDLVFTGQSDLATNRLSGWHRDSDGVSKDQESLLKARDFKILKLVFYAQDHDDEDDCFRYREGSHRNADSRRAPVKTIPTSAGDILLFDVRLSHAGRIADPFELFVHRGAKLFYPGYPAQDKHPARVRRKYCEIRRRKNRTGLFFSFGVNNAWTDSFARVNGSRQEHYKRAIGHSCDTTLDAGLVSALQEQGVRNAHL